MSKILEKMWFIETSIKSKVKFNWDFYAELENLMELVEKAIEEEIAPKFHIEYTDGWNASIKIKVNDADKKIEKLITCNFTYNKTDEKFWYVDPQFLSSEISKKTQVYNMWKFPIKDKKKILQKFVEKLIFIIEEY